MASPSFLHLANSTISYRVTRNPIHSLFRNPTVSLVLKFKPFFSYAHTHHSSRPPHRIVACSGDDKNNSHFRRDNKNEPKKSGDEPKNQNATGPIDKEVNLMRLCMQGKLEDVMEHMGRGVSADYKVFCMLLALCPTLTVGMKVHEYVKQSHFASDSEIFSRLIEMYLRHGAVKDAREVFDLMPERSVSVWNLMVNGYAVVGQGGEGMALFEEMIESGLTPDWESYVSVLAACTSSGTRAVEQGVQHFISMKEDYDIDPEIGHYVGLVELLGKSGHLNEAVGVVGKMHIEPTVEVWRSLLDSARIHGDKKLEDRAEKMLAKLDVPNLDESFLLGLDPPPLRPRNKYSEINMAEEKSNVSESNTMDVPGVVRWCLLMCLLFGVYLFV